MKLKFTNWIVPFLFIVMLFSTLNAFASIPKGTSWYKGSVEAAFAEAKKTNKPLFLYWGAVWCPPCNQMKKTIFSDKLFHTAVKDFIPVYLDGDTKRAQIWGEKLNVKGYPTTLIYSSSGKEVLRFPSGINVKKYVSLMKTSAKKMNPIEDVLKEALAGKATKEQWQILASYSWGQDYKVLTDAEKKLTTFKTLYEKIPSNLSVEKSILLFHYGKAYMSSEKKPDAKLRIHFADQFDAILKSEELLMANFEVLSYYPADIISFLYEKSDKRRKATIKLLLSKMTSIETGSKYIMPKRINALYPMIAIYKMDNPGKPIPERMKKTVKKMAEWANAEAKNAYERHAVMSDVTWLLGETEQFKLAEKMAKDELKISHSPYYFMSRLAGLAKKQGKKAEALDWYKKAWENSDGHATRFERATSYMQNLLTLDPKQEEAFKTTLEKAFDELLKEEDAFSGRKQNRLDRINTSVKKWNEDKSHDAFLTTLKKTLNDKCSASSKDESCKTWVQNLGV